MGAIKEQEQPEVLSRIIEELEYESMDMHIKLDRLKAFLGKQVYESIIGDKND